MTDDPSFNAVSQSAHVFAGAFAVVVLSVDAHLPSGGAAVIVMALAGAKEYWDSHGLESAAVAGNSYEDWAFYGIGASLGMVACWFGGLP